MKISVKPRKDELIWMEEESVKPNTSVTAATGVYALCVCRSGSYVDVVRPGQTEIVNGKKNIFEKVENAVLYGVDTTQNIDLKWGTIKPIDFKDETYGVILKIKCFGKSIICIRNIEKAFKYLKNKEAFTIEKIDEEFKEKLCSLCVDAVSKVAREKKDRFEFDSAKEEIKNIMERQFNLTIADQYGFELQSTEVLGAVVSGHEQLDELDKQNVEEKKRTELSEQKKLQAMHGVEVLQGLNKAGETTKDKKDSQAKDSPKTTNYNYCPKCGEKLLKHFDFCPKCGTNLSKY